MKKKILIGVIVAVFLALTVLCIFKLPAMLKYTPGDANIDKKIESIKIECTSGNITIIPTDNTYVSVEDTQYLALDQVADEEETLEWLVTGKTLKINCGAETDHEYIIGIPSETALDDVDIKGGKVNAQIMNLTIRDLTLRTDSGDLLVQGSKCIDALIAETQSASLQVNNTFARRMDIETVAGKVLMMVPSFQRDCKVVTDSGDIEIRIRDGSKANITESHGKGSFKSEFESVSDGDRFNLNTKSGKIEIVKYLAPEEISDYYYNESQQNTQETTTLPPSETETAKETGKVEKETTKKS